MCRLLLAVALALACGAAPLAAADASREELRLPAPGVSESPLRVRVWLPPDYAATQARYEVLYVNDGQDMEAVDLAATLRRLDAAHAVRRILVVAIDMPPDRMAGYGFFDRAAGAARVAPTRYGPVGANAAAYADWLARTLVPAIDARYRTVPDAGGRTLLGWSLGAASAFATGWQYPEVFGRVGAFSPSFWLAGDPARPGDTRLAHALVEQVRPAPPPRLFLAAGTAEEAGDRDRDGSIDVVDDLQELALGWRDGAGRAHPGLRQRGYAVNPDGARTPTSDAATVYLLEGGRHAQESWARMLPAFLRWAYGRDRVH